MANKDNKILDELRLRCKIFEDPCPKSESFMEKLMRVCHKSVTHPFLCVSGMTLT